MRGTVDPFDLRDSFVTHGPPLSCVISVLRDSSLYVNCVIKVVGLCFQF